MNDKMFGKYGITFVIILHWISIAYAFGKQLFTKLKKYKKNRGISIRHTAISYSLLKEASDIITLPQPLHTYVTYYIYISDRSLAILGNSAFIANMCC